MVYLKFNIVSEENNKFAIVFTAKVFKNISGDKKLLTDSDK